MEVTDSQGDVITMVIVQASEGWTRKFACIPDPFQSEFTLIAVNSKGGGGGGSFSSRVMQEILGQGKRYLIFF